MTTQQLDDGTHAMFRARVMINARRYDSRPIASHAVETTPWPGIDLDQHACSVCTSRPSDGYEPKHAVAS